MEIKEAIKTLSAAIEDPNKGLPEEVFKFISTITPMVNVDLLIKNDKGETLLTWRDDGYYPPSWHVPGGIIRFKEYFSSRLKVTAKNELGAEVEFSEKPIAINEIILSDREERGHFISFLYECRLLSGPDEELRCKDSEPKPGQWMWHDECPDNLISIHEMYRDLI